MGRALVWLAITSLWRVAGRPSVLSESSCPGYGSSPSDKGEGSAFVPFFQLYLTVMRLNDCAHDRKPHAHSMIFGGIEWVEDLLRGVLGYARPCVGDGDFGKLAVSRRRHCHCFLHLCRTPRGIKPI